jgi:hypothetical protein
MDVSMDGLVHPVREIDVRKYVLVYMYSSVAQRVSSLYAHACCTLSVPGALHEVQISCLWEARHFVMLCDGRAHRGRLFSSNASFRAAKVFPLFQSISARTHRPPRQRKRTRTRHGRNQKG